MTNLSVSVDEELKTKAENIFNELGLSMSAAMNIFLRAVVREKTFPSNLMIYIPNELTEKAIEEGLRIADDKSIKGYKNISDLKAALEK